MVRLDLLLFYLTIPSLTPREAYLSSMFWRKTTALSEQCLCSCLRQQTVFLKSHCRYIPCWARGILTMLAAPVLSGSVSVWTCNYWKICWRGRSGGIPGCEFSNSNSLLVKRVSCGEWADSFPRSAFCLARRPTLKSRVLDNECDWFLQPVT